MARGKNKGAPVAKKPVAKKVEDKPKKPKKAVKRG